MTAADPAVDEPAAEEPSSSSEAADDDPEAVPSAEDLALGIAGTVNEPEATTEDGQPDTREASPEAVCNERVKAAAETPGAQYVACVSPLEPAGEISGDEQAALSRSDASDDTSASESAVLAAVPDAGEAAQEASTSTEGTAEDAASEVCTGS